MDSVLFTSKEDSLELHHIRFDLYVDPDIYYDGEDITVISEVSFGMSYEDIRWSMKSLYDALPDRIVTDIDEYELCINKKGVHYEPLNKDTYTITFSSGDIIHDMAECIKWIYKNKSEVTITEK